MEYNKITIMLNEDDTKRYKKWLENMKEILPVRLIYKEMVQFGTKALSHKHGVEGMKDAHDNV